MGSWNIPFIQESSAERVLRNTLSRKETWIRAMHGMNGCEKTTRLLWSERAGEVGVPEALNIHLPTEYDI